MQLQGLSSVSGVSAVVAPRLIPVVIQVNVPGSSQSEWRTVQVREDEWIATRQEMFRTLMAEYARFEVREPKAPGEVERIVRHIFWFAAKQPAKGIRHPRDMLQESLCNKATEILLQEAQTKGILDAVCQDVSAHLHAMESVPQDSG